MNTRNLTIQDISNIQKYKCGLTDTFENAKQSSNNDKSCEISAGRGTCKYGTPGHDTRNRVQTKATKRAQGLNRKRNILESEIFGNRQSLYQSI